MSRKAFVDLSILLVATICGWWAITNQQAIKDWWVLRSYEPSSTIVELAEVTTMTDEAERIFYASRPEINDRASFNSNCPFPDRSLVLGCYSGGRIYIFNIDNEKLDGIEEVTAAHEMLHAVYARLNQDDKSRVDGLVKNQAELVKDPRLKDLIKSYQEEDPDNFSNELHSILGTELNTLIPDLEAHYSKYFDDRQSIVRLSEGYESVFADLTGTIGSLESRIDNLKVQINDTEASLTAQKAALDSESNRLNSLKQNGKIAEYNAAVPAYNAQVVAYNKTIESYKALVAKHNKLVAEHNALATEQNQLIHSIDSKFDPIKN